MKTIGHVVVAAAMALGLLALPAATALGSSHPAPDYRHACATSVPAGQAACLALVRTNVASYQGVRADVTPAGYGPASLRSAYKLATAAADSGHGQTVAIVDVGGDPRIASDLRTYRSQFGLAACATGCFRQVNETGGTSLPGVVSGWPIEISLDVDMVSAICPNCHIVLVEASSASLSDLGTGVNTAVQLGTRFVSNSYGAAEFSGETADDAFYEHPGVAITAGAGDDGFGVSYPAAVPSVTAVGGTSLVRSSNARGWRETVWGDGGSGTGEGTGSGCSTIEPKPAWQADSGCASRTSADVSADADPNTGVAVYDTEDAGGGWVEVGGTSAATPVVAAAYALAGRPGASDTASQYPYQHAARLFDVTSGSNGACGTYLCHGEAGYDGPTGLGTPDGTSAFKPVDNTITVTRPGTRAGIKGRTISRLHIHASDTATGQSLAYHATGLPAGLSINHSTGVISGKPTKREVRSVTVTASDNTGATASASFSWSVSSVGAITSGLSARRCLTDKGGKTATRYPDQIARCNGGTSQRWAVTPLRGGAVEIHLVKGEPARSCLSVLGAGTTAGTRVVSSNCVLTSSQEWTAGARGHLTGKHSGKCIGDPGSGPNGTHLRIAVCTTAAREHWNLP
jgi:Putative Ig domain/Ricin-type beta-trefoil lectin domain